MSRKGPVPADSPAPPAPRRRAERLAPEVFGLPAAAMRAGHYTDQYFNWARRVLEAEARAPSVTMQVFQKKDVLLAGTDEAVAILRLCVAEGYRWEDLEVWSLGDGDRAAPGETVMLIRGPYPAFAHLETLYLGALARGTRVATGTRRAVEAAWPAPVLYFAARHDHWAVQMADGWAAHVAGAAGVSTDAQGAWWGGSGEGTLPHSLIAAYSGDTVAATAALARRVPDSVRVVSLVDFDNDCVGTALEVARALGEKLYAVRLDTAENMVDRSLAGEAEAGGASARELRGVNRLARAQGAGCPRPERLRPCAHRGLGRVRRRQDPPLPQRRGSGGRLRGGLVADPGPGQLHGGRREGGRRSGRQGGTALSAQPVARAGGVTFITGRTRMTRIGWVVDVQRDFMEPDGRLYVRDLFDDGDPGAVTAEPRLVEAVEWMHAHAALVVYTGDWHGYDDAEIDAKNPDPGKGTYPPHCMGRSDGSRGAARRGDHSVAGLPDCLVLQVHATPTEVHALVARWRRRPRPVLIRKDRFDVFEGNRGADLFVESIARALDPVEFFVAGVARDVCVTQAIDGLQARGHRVTAIRDAMWGLGLEAEEDTLARWREKGRVIEVADLPRDETEAGGVGARRMSVPSPTGDRQPGAGR